MRIQIKKFPLRFSMIIVFMIVSLSLAACTSTAVESSPDKIKDQPTENIIPTVETVETDVGESDVTETDEVPYPDTEPETQNQEVDVIPQDTAYPEPEADIISQAESMDTQDEAYPAPPEEPVQKIKPTPRGNELVATNPSTVNLASGQLQLVELFAFW